MDNKDKLILNKLLKIASNQQKILQKLAQSVDPAGDADKALTDFVKFQFTSWAMPLEIAGGEQTVARRGSHSKDYSVEVTLSLQDKTKKTVAEDPQRGFAAFLTRKFAEATANQNSPLFGYTATFNVTVN